MSQEVLVGGLTINGEVAMVKFQVAPLVSYPMILGHEWLEEANPIIDWKQFTVYPRQQVAYLQVQDSEVFKGFEHMLSMETNKELPKH